MDQFFINVHKNHNVVSRNMMIRNAINSAVKKRQISLDLVLEICDKPGSDLGQSCPRSDPDRKKIEDKLVVKTPLRWSMHATLRRWMMFEILNFYLVWRNDR